MSIIGNNSITSYITGVKRRLKRKSFSEFIR